MNFTGSGIPELRNRVKKRSYRLRRHKTELSQIVTSNLNFRNSETLQWKNKNKKAELSNSKILLGKKFPIYLTQFFLLNASPKPYRPSKIFFWTKLGSKNKKDPSFTRFQGWILVLPILLILILLIVKLKKVLGWFG